MDETGVTEEHGAVGTVGEIEVTLAAAVPGSGEDDLRSLARWLREDENLAGLAACRIRDSAVPQPGSMGTLFDVLQLTIGSGLSAGALAVSIAQWWDARHRPPGITLRRGRTTVEIAAEEEVDVAALARALQFLTAQPAPARPAAAAPAASAAAAPAVAAPVPAPAPPASTEVPTDPAPVPQARSATVRTGEAAGDGTPS